MGLGPADDERYAFGPFQVVVAERLLSRDGEPITLRAKVFDTLVALLRAAGKLVTREELIAVVWPDSIVEEGNLTHNVSALRRALGDGDETAFVETVPRVGYRFVHPLGTPTATSSVAADPLACARRCLAQGAWDAAYRAFADAARDAALSGEDSAALAQAARWSGRFDELVPLLEAAADAHRREKNELGRARAVIELATLLLDRGRLALASSYLRQAERVLDRHPSDGFRERADWLRAQARVRLGEGDWPAALERSETALAAARSCTNPDVEAMSLSDAAHALLALDRFEDAERHLDEAGAALTSGEIGPYAKGMTLCGLIYGWRALGRWDRAREWTDASMRWVDEDGVAYFPAHCRVHRGLLIGIAGELDRAEADLSRGTHELARASSGYVGAGWRDLGVIRLRRGDLAGAEEAFARALEVGMDPQPGLAQLRAARGERAEARRDLERFLSAAGGASRTVLEREQRFEALAAVALLALEAEDLGAAREAHASMTAIAHGARSSYHRATLDGIAGALSLADGRSEAALAQLRSSLREWTNLPAPYEAAMIRERIGLALLAEGDAKRAEVEFAGAADSFERMHAALDARRLEERRLALANEGPPRSRRMVVCGTIVDAERLQALVGPEAWADLTAWLERTLRRCWSDRGGVPLALRNGDYAVHFEGGRAALACIAHVQRSLREHRARHGFAPRLHMACADAGLLGEHSAPAALCEIAQDVLRRSPPADVLVVTGQGPLEYGAELERLRADGFDVRVLEHDTHPTYSARSTTRS